MNTTALIPVGSLVVGPVEFLAPVWLWLIPIIGAACVVLARKSLSGLESWWKWVALVVRLIVITLLAGALAEPLWRKVARDVAVTAIIDVSDSIPTQLQRQLPDYFHDTLVGKERETDQLGFITTAAGAYVANLPSPSNTGYEQSHHQGNFTATNLESGIRLAIATASKDAAGRFLLVTDGNETAGDLLKAAQSAKALGIPIDVLPLRFKYEGEVLVDRFITPAATREGETMNLRVVLQASKAARGRLLLRMNGDPIDLDPASESLGARVELREGQNVLQVPVLALKSGPQKFEADFEPDMLGGQAQGDVLPQNNRGVSVTFVAGEGKVLILSDNPQESDALLKALEAANLRSEVRTSGSAPTTLTELSAYEAIILVNQSAFGFSQKQQEDLRQYVHDTGGGLVMIGGPNSFGAGGWIGSPMEEALPVRLDPPQKRQMPRGALVLCIHSVEFPEGVYWGKKVCEAAVNRLSRLDLIGINEYTWNGGTQWVYPLEADGSLKQVGDGTLVKRAIQNLQFGDMPDFTPSFQLSLAAMKKSAAGQRHMIVVSDGDPSPPPTSLLQEFKDARITVSTVGIGVHGGNDQSNMEEIARLTGGRFYDVAALGGVTKLPEIFIKEAMTVRRSLIAEYPDGVLPSLTAGASEALRGVRGVPPINGYVVTAEREGLALVTAKVGASKDNPQGDPLLAQWQYGLGRVVAYTSDGASRWNSGWMGWEGYKQFWEQHVRWVLRPQGSGNVRVNTENRGDQTLVTVEAFDTQGERLSFADFQGRLARPDGQGEDVRMVQVAPGRYQAVLPTEEAGSYVLSLRYAGQDVGVEGGVLEGSVQAAISRPFADEYRVLQDNTALLTQVAEVTGGRVLTGDAGKDKLWTREGLKMPVATTPIWYTLAVLGVAVFVMDVGVRRVRIDFAAIGAWVRRGFTKSKVQAGQQMGSLRAARAQARERIAQRAASSGQQVSADQLAAQAKADVKRAQQVAGTKFEASAQDVRRLAKEAIAIGGAGVRPTKTPVKEGPTDAQQLAPEEGMSRLMKAKQKAREGMEEQ